MLAWQVEFTDAASFDDFSYVGRIFKSLSMNINIDS